MHVPSLNEINESIFELSHTQVKTYAGCSKTDLKPVYSLLSSGDMIIIFQKVEMKRLFHILCDGETESV